MKIVMEGGPADGELIEVPDNIGPEIKYAVRPGPFQASTEPQPLADGLYDAVYREDNIYPRTYRFDPFASPDVSDRKPGTARGRIVVPERKIFGDGHGLIEHVRDAYLLLSDEAMHKDGFRPERLTIELDIRPV